MGDAITAAIGAVILMGYLWLIADRLNEVPLWIACICGVGLMLWAFWHDDWKPVLKRDSK